MRIGIVSYQWNSGAFLEEWIRFHLAVGVTDIVIWDEESTDDTQQVLRKFNRKGVVCAGIVKAPGKREESHFPNYMKVLKSSVSQTEKCDWVGFLDQDELLVPQRTWGVQELFGMLPSTVNAVAINWRMMGQRHKEGASLLEITNAFPDSYGPNHKTKGFVRTAKVSIKDWWSPHVPPKGDGECWLDFCHSAFFDKVISKSVSHSFSAINHYRWRSPEEFARRRRKFDVQEPKECPKSPEGVKNLRAVEVARHHGIVVNV